MSTHDPQPRYLNVQAAANYCSCSPATVRRWIDQGALPSFRVGEKLIRVDRADLDRFVRGDNPQRRAHDERRGGANESTSVDASAV